MKIREGKTFIEFTDNCGWKTKINIRKSDTSIEITQQNEGTYRYINLNGEEGKLFYKKLKELVE